MRAAACLIPNFSRQYLTLRSRSARCCSGSLGAEERRLLADPGWVTEDEADIIIGLRGAREGGFISHEEIKKRYGYRRSKPARTVAH